MSRTSSTLHLQARLVPCRCSLLNKLRPLCYGVSISCKLVGSAQQGQGITSTCCCGRLQHRRLHKHAVVLGFSTWT